MISHNSVWAMDKSKLTAMLDGVRVMALPTQRQIEAYRLAVARKLSKVNGKVAVIPVRGIIEQRASYLSYYFGGVGADDLGRTIDALVANKDVQAIVLDIASPGGTSWGVQELSDKIFRHRGAKQLIAIANSCACSAAYWIGSSCDQFYASPGADIGSVGVYSMHIDESKALDEIGLKVTFIAAGRYKVEGNSAEPLGDDAKAHLQLLVDETYRAFVDAVARNRGTTSKDVRANFGEGRYFLATKAPSGMIDKVMTLDEILAKLSGTLADEGRRSMEVLRLRQQQRKREASWVAAQTAAGA